MVPAPYCNQLNIYDKLHGILIAHTKGVVKENQTSIHREQVKWRDMKRGKTEELKGRYGDPPAEIIMRVISLERQGFILPPREAKDLLGSSSEDGQWYHHKKIDHLRRALSERFIAMEVHPTEGITIVPSRRADEPRILCSPKNIRY